MVETEYVEQLSLEQQKKYWSLLLEEQSPSNDTNKITKDDFDFIQRALASGFLKHMDIFQERLLSR